MPDLLGAWSLSDQPVGRLLEAGAKSRMLDMLSGGEDSFESRRLWLVAGSVEREEAGIVARQGFVPEGGDEVDGHSVTARASDEALFLTRSLSGGERLYFTRVGNLLLFASSVRLLLAHPSVPRRIDPEVLDEVLLTGLPISGARTLHAEIAEVLPGCTLRVDDAVRAQRFVHPELLEPPVGSPGELGRRFREALTEAVARAAGPDRPVCVALSGGIDSSAIAAAAVDAFGADGVRAVTYEFGDPEHSTEREWATKVARHLGIERHHFFELSKADYLDAIPEHVFRSESLSHWPKAFMLLVAREVRALGHDRYLTGFGIGSHMAYLSELAPALERTPRLVTGHWRAARFDRRAWPFRFGRVHPAFEPPHPRIYALLARQLEHAGIVRDAKAFFPDNLWPLLSHRPDLSLLEPEVAALPLRERLLRAAFVHLVSCVDVTRSEKASRELGVLRISPAHFASCLPYAYLPITPRPRLYSAARALRPGKLLLQQGFRGAIPDEVLFRVKSWADAVASDGWLRDGRRRMLSVLPSFPFDMDRHGPGYPAVIQKWEASSLLATCLAFRLWERMFVEMPLRREAPTWMELWDEAHPSAREAPALRASA